MLSHPLAAVAAHIPSPFWDAVLMVVLLLVRRSWLGLTRFAFGREEDCVAIVGPPR